MADLQLSNIISKPMVQGLNQGLCYTKLSFRWKVLSGSEAGPYTGG